MIFILADHDKQQRLTSVCNIKKVTNTCIYAIMVKPIILCVIYDGCLCVCLFINKLVGAHWPGPRRPESVIDYS